MNDIKIESGHSSICEVELLEVTSDNHINLASDCIADCLVGINVNGVIKYEPMNVALNIEKNVSKKFFHNLLEDIRGKGISFIVKDLKSGSIVGTLISEIYDPNIKIVKYTGDFEPYNHLFEFLDTLDFKFNEYIEKTTGQQVKKDEYLHMHAIGIKVKGRNMDIFEQLMLRVESYARERGLKGILAEVTNPKSERPLIDKFGYIIPIDSEGNQIALDYKNSDIFKNIPSDVATHCKLVFKKL